MIARPVLPNPHWPQADIGTSKYKSTQPMSVTTSDTLYRLLHGTENLPVDRQIHIYRILPHFYMNECHEHGKRGMTSNGVCFGRVRENGFGSSAQFHRPKKTNMQNISRIWPGGPGQAMRSQNRARVQNKHRLRSYLFYHGHESACLQRKTSSAPSPAPSNYRTRFLTFAPNIPWDLCNTELHLVHFTHKVHISKLTNESGARAE